MKIVISGADHEVLPILGSGECFISYKDPVSIKVLINGVETDTVITSYQETARNTGRDCLLFWEQRERKNINLTLESCVQAITKEEAKAQEAVEKAKESLKAAEDTLKAVKDKKC